MNNTMLLAGLKSGEIDIGIGRMSDPELMSGLHYELLFPESLKLVVRPGHPLLQETVTLSRVMEWPVVVSPKGTVPRQNAEALLQSQGCKMPAGCIETLSASLSRQLTVDFDYVWFVPSGAVKDDLRRGVLTALPIATQGAGEPIGILTRVDATLTPGTQTLLSAIRKSMPACPPFSPARSGRGTCKRADAAPHDVRHIRQNNHLVRNYLLTFAQTSLTDLSCLDFTKWFTRNLIKQQIQFYEG